MTTEYSKPRCVGCEGELSVLTPEVIAEKLQALSGWAVDESGKKLQCTFSFNGFGKTMAFVNAVAWIAHQQGHHPDMEVSFNRCTVNYTTHAVDGITENDFICANEVSDLLI